MPVDACGADWTAIWQAGNLFGWFTVSVSVTGSTRENGKSKSSNLQHRSFLVQDYPTCHDFKMSVLFCVLIGQVTNKL